MSPQGALNAPDFTRPLPDPLPHTSMALTSGLTAVIICVLVWGTPLPDYRAL